MKLIVGLGNPGKKYEHTRHNIGFVVLTKLCEKIHAPAFRKRRKYFVSKKNDWIFLLPRTFMNLSGIAVKKAMKKYDICPKNLLVISDDINLSVGNIRIRENGGDGNHNGLKSIISEIQSQNFPRLRIGISSENSLSEISLTEFVLSRFTKNEMRILDKLIPKIIDMIADFLFGDYQKLCSAYSKIKPLLKNQTEFDS